MDGELGARSGDDLLLSGACELTQDGLRDGSGGLDRERVHKHMRGSSHGAVVGSA